MKSVIECINSRASVRKYKADQVPKEDIDKILECGVRAPSGMNSQCLEFLVIQDKERISAINKAAKPVFRDHMIKIGQISDYISKICEDDSKNIFYNANTLIMIYAKQGTFSPEVDGSLAAENIMLSAHALGYGTCYIGFAMPYMDSAEFREEYNIPNDRIMAACLILGVPDGDTAIKSRNPPVIIDWL